VLARSFGTVEVDYPARKIKNRALDQGNFQVDITCVLHPRKHNESMEEIDDKEAF
jgi:hypothetical protein